MPFYNLTMKKIEEMAVDQEVIAHELDVFNRSQSFRVALSNEFPTEGRDTEPNIGHIGAGVSYASAVPRNPMQDSYPLTDWLMSNPAATRMRAHVTQGLGNIRRANNNLSGWEVSLPPLVHTLEPPDTTGRCCFAPMDLAVCGESTPLALVCLEDSWNISDGMWQNMQTAGNIDMVGVWQRQGESTRTARRRWARICFAFYTAHNIILGESTTDGPWIRPAHGLREVMERPTVANFDGSKMLGAFDEYYCRLRIVGDVAGTVFWMHRLVLDSIREQIRPDVNGHRPEGWEVDAMGNVTFHRLPLREAEAQNINLEAVIPHGDVLCLNANDTFALTAAPLLVPENDGDPRKFQFHRPIFEGATQRPDDCGGEREYLYNGFGVDNFNDNKIAIISGVPISSACSGQALKGLDALINISTLIPLA